MIEPIRIDGLRQFNRNLRRINGDLPKGLKDAGNAAAQIVVNDAKPRVPTGPGKGGHAASSIKVASTRTAVRISAGGKKYPYYPWLDFGGSVGPGKRSKRPFLKTGRYIWKAFADNKDQVQTKLADELEKLARRAGLDVS